MKCESLVAVIVSSLLSQTFGAFLILNSIVQMVRKFFEYSVILNADRIEILKTNKINFSNCNSSADA